MSRPLRVEFPGAVYHVTARGDRREPIYHQDSDRLAFLDVLAQALQRFDAQVLAYCLMGNHYHLVLQTHQANLSRLMRHVNGVYTQRFNARHALVGHLLQGRFKAIVVDREAYLLTLCRYVERNPVAAGLVTRAQEWPWSSARAHLALVDAPTWLDRDGLHALLLGRPVADAADRQRAAGLYAEWLGQPVATDFWRCGLRRQVFLGDEAFVARALAHAGSTGRVPSSEVPKAQRRQPLSLRSMLEAGMDRDSALHAAYTAGGATMRQLAQTLGLSVSRVSRLIAAVEGEGRAKGKT